jgi:LPS export ABC transporter permease LptG
VRILSRYFVSGYLTYYAAIVAVSLLVIAIVEMMVNFDHVIEYGEGMAGMAAYLFLRLPSYYLPFLIPVGSFGAAFLCLGLPARSLEILAAKASGISPGRLAAPVLASAAVLSLVALALNETIVLDASRRFNSERSGGEIFQSRGSFWYHRGSTLFSVESADREARTLQGVTVYERDDRGHLLQSVHAESAHIEDDRRWRLENARFRAFDPDDPLAPPRTEVREIAWLELGSADDLALLDADARSLSLLRLRTQIAALERENRDATRYRAQWHARLADPLSVVLFALLGTPLGMLVERSRSLAVAALQAIALLGAYYGLQTTASVFGAGGVAAAVAAPWAVQALFAGFGAWRLARVSL